MWTPSELVQYSYSRWNTVVTVMDHWLHLHWWWNAKAHFSKGLLHLINFFFFKDFCDTKTIPIPWNTNASIYILCIFSYLYIWSFFIPSWCFDVFFVTVCYLDYVVRYYYKSLWISVSFACLCCILLFMCFIICINKRQILTEIFVY